MTIVTTYYAHNEFDFELDIFLLNSRIFTTSDLSWLDKNLKKGKSNYLCISIEIEIDEFASVIDGAAYARPRYLIILGILSFMTQEVFTPFQFASSSTVRDKILKPTKEKFKLHGNNYLDIVVGIAKFIETKTENERRLFYSLLDRWRKAFYLEKESEDNMIHDDEILLSYFHILELMAEEYYPELKQKAQLRIKEFVEAHIREIQFIEGVAIQNELTYKSKLVESILVSELSVGSKICFTLSKKGLLSNRLKYFISDLIRDRNLVAHGNSVYQEKVIFPVPPFFPLIKNREYPFNTLRILTGRLIALYVEIEHLDEEWGELELNLSPTLDEVSLFLKEKKYEKISTSDFYSGAYNDVTPFVVTSFLISKKLSPEKVLPSFNNLIQKYKKNENETLQIILAVLILVDFIDKSQKDKCVEIIKVAAKNNWIPDSKMRDILYLLEYLGFKPVTLRNLVSSKEVR